MTAPILTSEQRATWVRAIAAKAHTCVLCEGQIKPGAEHHVRRFWRDGVKHTERQHRAFLCDDVQAQFPRAKPSVVDFPVWPETVEPPEPIRERSTRADNAGTAFISLCLILIGLILAAGAIAMIWGPK